MMRKVFSFLEDWLEGGPRSSRKLISHVVTSWSMLGLQGGYLFFDN